MSLDFSVKRVKDYSELFIIDDDGVDRVCDLTKCVVFSTLAIGLSEITANNVDEWVFRSTMLHSVGRAVISRGGKSSALARAEIIRHIGLTTNATTCTRKHFLRKLIECIESEIERNCRREELIDGLCESDKRMGTAETSAS
jgi:hypothetical protein